MLAATLRFPKKLDPLKNWAILTSESAQAEWGAFFSELVLTNTILNLLLVTIASKSPNVLNWEKL